MFARIDGALDLLAKQLLCSSDAVKEEAKYRVVCSQVQCFQDLPMHHFCSTALGSVHSIWKVSCRHRCGWKSLAGLLEEEMRKWTLFLTSGDATYTQRKNMPTVITVLNQKRS